jgi:hypothetical protein
MIRPLYLDAGLPWQVRLDDGPALHLSAPGRARTLVPLNQLARVVSPANANWHSAALLACLRAGVPVLFSDGNGAIVAWCFGPRRRETTLGQLLRLSLEAPDGANVLVQWHAACGRREMLATLRALGIRSLPARASLLPADVRARLCNLHRQRMGRAPGAWLHALERQTQALAAQQVYDSVGDPALIGHAAPGWHLGVALAQLLQWRLHRVLHDNPPDATESSARSARWAAQAVETHGAQLAAAAGAQLGQLEAHLRLHLT